MRTLVIADLHHQTSTADEILATEPHDRVVFLGDYFDSHFDTPAHAHATATWVKARLADPRCTLLFGNHDLPYAFADLANGFLACSGFDHAKAEAIASVLIPSDWLRLAAMAQVGPWLLSHAGFHRELLPQAIVRDAAALQARCERALRALCKGQPDLLFAAGRDRGGPNTVGGITWCDWKRFEPIAGIHQIVGHTPSKDEPLRHWSPPWTRNYCIDFSNGRVYAVIEDARTTIRRSFGRGHESETLDEIHHEVLKRSRQTPLSFRHQ